MRVSVSQRGFTLMEILVATVATAILLVALYGVFSRAVRLRDSGVARMQKLSLQTRALELLRDDLRHALVTGARLAATLEGSPNAPDSRFPGYLRLTTASTPGSWSETRPDLQEVEYFIVVDPWSTNSAAGALVRTVNRNLLAQVEEDPQEETLLHGVESLEVRFYDGANWLDTWNFVDTESSLPAAVEVTVRAEGARSAGDAMPPLFRLVEPWPIQVLAESAGSDSTNNASGGAQGGPQGGASGSAGGGGGSPPQGGGR